MDLESDYQVPPPAYSEEEEFDQKVSIATEISAHASVADADGWEVYDPYAFENHSDMGVSKSEWPGHIHSSSTHIRIEKIPQSKSVDSVQLSPLNKYSMKDHQMQHANSVASSSQWHEADSLPGKGTLQRSEAYTSASFSLHCPQDIPPDGVYYAASCKDLPSPQVWQPERHTPLRYSFDAQPPAPYRASYQDTRIDAQSEYDGSAQSRRLRSLPPTPTPPRRQLLFQERPMASYHPIQPPVIKFDTSIAYSNTPSSPSLPHHHPASARPDAKYDSYSFYNSAVSAQLNTSKNSQHGRAPISASYSSQRQYQAPMALPTDLSPNRRSHFQVNQRPDSTYTIPDFSSGSTIDDNRSSWH